jgi:hypothetical protein
VHAQNAQNWTASIVIGLEPKSSHNGSICVPTPDERRVAADEQNGGYTRSGPNRR